MKQQNQKKDQTTQTAEIEMLKEKVGQYERKLKFYIDQQQKIKDLQKINTQNSTRLLQCVSNVRDLLHSNKKLREQLNHQRTVRLQLQTALGNLQNYKRQQINLQNNKPNKNFKKSSNKQLFTSKRHKITQENLQPTGIINQQKINLHKIAKFEKFEKLKSYSKRLSTQPLENINISPTKSASNYFSHKFNPFDQTYTHNFKQKSLRIQQIGKKYEGSSQVIKQQKYRSTYKRSKYSKSVDLVKEEEKYKKAMEKRKKSIKKSSKLFQQLEYKPK